MSFIDKVEAFFTKAFHSFGNLTDRMDTASWIVVALVALVVSLFFMKGSPVKGA